jgi:hypothetical protein
MPELTPDEIAERLNAHASGVPPSLPDAWTSQGLLFPFGDANPTMQNYDQVVVANLAYDWSQKMMRVSLYLLEAMTYFDFLFDGDNGWWYWLVSSPGQKPTGYYGPFPSNVLVPAPNFLAKAKFAKCWFICDAMTENWLVPTAPKRDVPPHGTWYSFKFGTTALWRVLNLDNDNPVGIPVLGSYYMAYLPGFQPRGPLNLRSLISGTQYSGSPVADMVSQRDIQSNLANPLTSAPCTLADIQVVIPGISHPSTQPTLPVWTDKTYIQAMTIGCDPIPYYTTIWYWWTYQHMRTEFIGYAQTNGTGTYYDRTDMVMYANYFTRPYYQIVEGQWVNKACMKSLSGVGLPRPDFLAADKGLVRAIVSGNSDFGLQPGQSISMISAAMPRGKNKHGVDVTSLFWFWFANDQSGKLFAECNYIDTVIDHDLQVIDYVTFTRNADDMVNKDSFFDPCPPPEADGPPPARVVRHPGF